jgi:hypothetical protein
MQTTWYGFVETSIEEIMQTNRGAVMWIGGDFNLTDTQWGLLEVE